MMIISENCQLFEHISEGLDSSHFYCICNSLYPIISTLLLSTYQPFNCKFPCPIFELSVVSLTFGLVGPVDYNVCPSAFQTPHKPIPFEPFLRYVLLCSTVGIMYTRVNVVPTISSFVAIFDLHIVKLLSIRSFLQSLNLLFTCGVTDPFKCITFIGYTLSI